VDAMPWGGIGTDRLPPSNTQAEQALLGSLLRNNKVAEKVAFLRPHHFVDPVNGKTFEEAMKLIGQHRVADTVIMSTILEPSPAYDPFGGVVPYLNSLTVAMVGIINANDYAKLVRDMWLRRQLIDIGTDLVNSSFGTESASDPLAHARRIINEIEEISAGAESLTGNMVSIGAAVDAALQAMEDARKHGVTGIQTQFKCINDRIGGFEGGLVYAIGGRPGSGKSSLGHQLALHAAESGVGVLELSLEMSSIQLGRRALSIASGVPLWVMKKGMATLEQGERLHHARRKLLDLPLTIDDAMGQSRSIIQAKVRAAVKAAIRKKGRIGLIMIDHINLIKAEDADHGPTHATGETSHMMLQIAKENNVAVLELVQLNRGLEGRDDKRPNLGDLRQSGDIEQDAFAVGFVYRDEMYVGGEPIQGADELLDRFETRRANRAKKLMESAGKAELIWGKIRDGKIGTDKLFFDGETTSFSEPMTDEAPL
jgi:replicative DNA helicase